MDSALTDSHSRRSLALAPRMLVLRISRRSLSLAPRNAIIYRPFPGSDHRDMETTYGAEALVFVADHGEDEERTGGF